MRKDFLLLPSSFLLLTSRFCLLTSVLSLLTFVSVAQSDIPLGAWRMHLSFNTIRSIAVSDTHVYGATESGIVSFDKSDKSLVVINKLNGLSATGISYIGFDEFNRQLLVAYEDGNLDVIKDNSVTNFDRLKNLNTVSENKAIHHIAIRDDLAYLATDFGVVVFDLKKIELKETWRDLDATGKTLKIMETAFLDDSIFLATEKGIMAGSLQTNLLDFNNWKRFDTGDLASPVASIEMFDAKVYAAINGKGIYAYQQGVWTRENFLQNETFNDLSAASASLMIATTKTLWQLTASTGFIPVTSELITAPFAVKGDGGLIWVGDGENGLLSNTTGNFESYVPNGPSIPSVFRLKFADGRIFALQGGYTLAGTPKNNIGKVNVFADGAWETSLSALGDLTDVDFVNNELFIASFRDGVERIDVSGNRTVFDNSNSSLQNVLPVEKSVFISAIERSGDRLLVANYGTTQSLHIFSQGAWQGYSFPFPSASFPVDIALDFLGNIWMPLDPLRGGGILVATANGNRHLTDVAGNGGLPTKEVRSIVSDREGTIWVGTERGVVYFTDPTDDAILPIFENRFLLRDEKITAIEVDGGNRKWIGTERGVWLFSPTGEELIVNFTEQNSPLLSNHIHDIEIHPATGEVFFATGKGVVSYRSDATTALPEFGDLKIFPNPVDGNFSGVVGISGLASDAIVKITDISGKLIWQTQANGGTATWNVRDYNGKRAATGIYLVFAATENGSESVVGKIAVVE